MAFPSGGIGTAAEGRQYESFAAAAIGTDGDALIKLGEGFALPDGRVYRFGKNGATTGVANKTAMSSIPVAGFDTLAVQANVAAGDSSIPFTNGNVAIVHGDLDEGFCIVESAAALGHAYKIRNVRGTEVGATHANIGDVGTTNTGTINLYPGASVIVALTTSHKITLIFNPFFETLIAASPVTAMVVGVPQIALAIGAYGWYQTNGMGSCHVTGTTKIGGVLSPSNTTDGSLEEPDQLLAEAAPPTSHFEAVQIAVSMEVAPTTDFQACFFTIG